MSVSAYGHCRPGVEGYDSWERGSKEKHTTHLSSTQEERSQWSNDSRQRQMAPAVRFIIPLYTRETSRSLSRRGNGSASAGHVTAARPAGSPREVWLWNSPGGCENMPAGLAGVTKRRAQGCGPEYPSERSGGAGLVSLGAADRRSSQGGGTILVLS